MTVAELKEILTQFPDEAKVVVVAMSPEAVEALKQRPAVEPIFVRREAACVKINRDYEVSIS